MLALQGGAGLVDQEPLAVIHYKVKAQLVQQFSETLSTSMVDLRLDWHVVSSSLEFPAFPPSPASLNICGGSYPKFSELLSCEPWQPQIGRKQAI
ncbi:50S ribosomal protein L13 [Frankliniella fusca]|uniref:50S ribosomal protein L13 n=1 Tax=Frankliniella fusca TaxID=407009 RepID=A0AAE1HJ58_9NEOP|nr:50S ribosomal protein L13 [Frankliniella fusca]